MNLELLKQTKKQKGLTLLDISTLSGIPKRTVDDIFAGKTINPRIDTVKAIEKALGINLTANDNELTERETRLLEAFNGLIPPMQDYILDMVEKLVAQPQNANKRA